MQDSKQLQPQCRRAAAERACASLTFRGIRSASSSTPLLIPSTVAGTAPGDRSRRRKSSRTSGCNARRWPASSVHCSICNGDFTNRKSRHAERSLARCPTLPYCGLDCTSCMRAAVCRLASGCGDTV